MTENLVPLYSPRIKITIRDIPNIIYREIYFKKYFFFLEFFFLKKNFKLLRKHFSFYLARRFMERRDPLFKDDWLSQSGKNSKQINH